MLHPLLMPSYCILLYFTISFMKVQPKTMLVTLALQTINFTAVLPCIVMTVFIIATRSTQIALNDTLGKRVVPCFVFAAALMWCAVMMWISHMAEFIYGTFFSFACAMIVTALVNLWHRSSVHMAAVACLLGCVFHVWSESPINVFAPRFVGLHAFLIVICGLVASLSMLHRQHSGLEVFTGAAVGFLSGYLPLFIFY